jgi:hypothetical protein
LQFYFVGQRFGHKITKSQNELILKQHWCFGVLVAYHLSFKRFLLDFHAIVFSKGIKVNPLTQIDVTTVL